MLKMEGFFWWENWSHFQKLKIRAFPLMLGGHIGYLKNKPKVPIKSSDISEENSLPTWCCLDRAQDSNPPTSHRKITWPKCNNASGRWDLPDIFTSILSLHTAAGNDHISGTSWQFWKDDFPNFPLGGICMYPFPWRVSLAFLSPTFAEPSRLVIDPRLGPPLRVVGLPHGHTTMNPFGGFAEKCL